MLFLSCGWLLIIIAVNEVASRSYPKLEKYDSKIIEEKYIRPKRQFGFQDQNDDSPNNGIFFDDDNRFLDFVMPNRPRNNQINGFPNNGFQNNGFQNNGFQNNGFQNNGFRNNPNFFGRNDRPSPNFGSNAPTTQTPLAVTSVNVPGMGTTRSACEDMCLTTQQYNPVCGDNQITYTNIERFKCAVRCGRKIEIAAYRACPRF